MAPKSPRFHGYNALLVFSIVSIAAVAASLPGKQHQMDLVPHCRWDSLIVRRFDSHGL